jgi:hypothetical protein
MLGVGEKRSRLFLVAVPAMITPRRLRKKLTPRPARNASRSSSHFATRSVSRSDAGGRKDAKISEEREDAVPIRFLPVPVDRSLKAFSRTPVSSWH